MSNPFSFNSFIDDNKAIGSVAAKILAEGVTRKHFQQVADLIKANPDASKRAELAKHHAEIFAKQNPQFDHQKFYDASNSGLKHDTTVKESAELTLNSCPTCNTNKDVKIMDSTVHKGAHLIKCTHCGNTTSSAHSDKNNAISAWNNKKITKMPQHAGVFKEEEDIAKSMLTKEDTETTDHKWDDKKAPKKDDDDDNDNKGKGGNPFAKKDKDDDSDDDNEKDDDKDKKDKPIKESLLSEISKKVLGSYIKKASDDMVTQDRRSAEGRFAQGSRSTRLKAFNKLQNHEKGISTAVDKLTKEDEDLTELSKKTLGSYIKKASWKQTIISKDSFAAIDKADKRRRHIEKAVDKLTKEDEDLTEISKKVLGSYIKKASREQAFVSHSSFASIDKADKRRRYIEKAVDKLTKEDKAPDDTEPQTARGGVVVHEKDEFKPGKNFSKIEKSAAKEYGSKKAGERVAGAIRARLIAKHGGHVESVDDNDQDKKIEEGKSDGLGMSMEPGRHGFWNKEQADAHDRKEAAARKKYRSDAAKRGAKTRSKNKKSKLTETVLGVIRGHDITIFENHEEKDLLEWNSHAEAKAFMLGRGLKGTRIVKVKKRRGGGHSYHVAKGEKLITPKDIK